MTWSPQQETALKSVRAWLADRAGPQVFRLFGFAGTGKTTLARELAAGVARGVCYATFTGKAALVLRSKGCDDASTIHSLIYRVQEDEITGAPTFVRNAESMAGQVGLIIIDEASMVDELIGHDLLSFGTRVLVLGDPFQLPPVRGTGFFTDCDPDVMLTEVHRQARDNPIIRLSMDVREGLGLTHGTYGDSAVITRHQLTTEMVTGADQVLVGLNRTRRAYNNRLRDLLGFSGALPSPGERLVCLKNNRDKGLLNGGIWTVLEELATNDNASIPSVEIRVKSLDEGGPPAPVDVDVPIDFFRGLEQRLHWRDRKKYDEFDYGYALTVHKAQGSQWSNVVLFDESSTFREDAARWLYTGITRAAEKVTVVAP